MNTSVVGKNKNLTEQAFDGEANWSGVVNFHCMQMVLVMSMPFVFFDDLNDAKCSSRSCSLAMM